MAEVEVPNATNGKVEDKSDKSSTASSVSGSTPSLDADAGSQGKSRGAARDVKDGNTTISRRLNLKKSFRILSSQMKPAEKGQDKNEPSRFLGEGVSFKAKLIGILEVSEARGDRMCQEALADLKMAIRAAGEHKQRITINIAIDGLRLRDEKNGDCLFHHPVHKISFIAQDMSDSRAFGYIFGSPDTGHRFFGIKTDKAASQVVIAMRDLFQVVFELKKKEIEMAKQHIEQHQTKIGSGMFMDPSPSSKNGVGSSDQSTAKRSIREDTIKENGNSSTSTKSTHKTSEEIADLLDLEFELNSIRQGIHQMERITPSDPFGPSAGRDSFGSDPFGDSFTPPAVIPPPPKSVKTSVSLLPPPSTKEPPPARTADPFNVPPPSRQPHRRGGVRGRSAAAEKFNSAVVEANKSVELTPPPPQQEKHWFDQETESLFADSDVGSPAFISSNNTSTFSNLTEPMNDMSRSSPSQQTGLFDVFTELDPLGTGRSKPYIDRKDFFQDLKNPPKKVLKDLVTELPSEATAPLFEATFDSSGNRHSDPNISIGSNGSQEVASFPATDPFNDVDPFYHTDPFQEPFPSNSDPFKVTFADFAKFGGEQRNVFAPMDESFDAHDALTARSTSSPQPDASQSVFSPRTNFHGPLRVSLPPEKSGGAAQDESLDPTRTRSANVAKPRTRSRLHKQTTLSGLPKLPSPKSMPRASRLAKQITVDGIRQSELPTPAIACFPDTDGAAFEIAPEPPPRPTLGAVAPPPLPPKRQQQVHALRPPPRPPHADDQHYDYIENYETSASPTPRESEEAKSPPIPVPARRPRFALDDAGTAPQRPRRNPPPRAEDDYLTPTPFPLIPPPQKRGHDAKAAAAMPVPTTMAPTPGASETDAKQSQATSLNLTLSQLTKTGFTDLAVALGISPSELSNMTLQELTICLAKLSEEVKPEPVADEGEKAAESGKREPGILRTFQLSADARAKFDRYFEESDKKKLPEDAFQETLFDKYAVFRELINDEKTDTSPDHADPDDEVDDADVFEECTFDDDPAPGSETASPLTTGDRYAALRDISLDDCDVALSDKEDSGAVEEEDDLLTLSRQHSSESPTMETATMRGSVMETTIYEEDVSTLEADNDDAAEDVPEIVEEEAESDAVAAVTVDNKAPLATEAFDLSPSPEREDAGSFRDEPTSLRTETPSFRTETPSFRAETPSVRDETQSLRGDTPSFRAETPSLRGETPRLRAETPNLRVETPSFRDEPASYRTETPITDTPATETPATETPADGWAKFETAAASDAWSSDGREVKAASPVWQERFEEPAPAEGRKGGRGAREGGGRGGRSPWADESEGEGRENGWSEGEGFYDDGRGRRERGYHDDRRGRRRRVSPWKKGQRSSRDVSPWEHGRYPDRSLDDEEDDEDYDRRWRGRPQHRGSSWDDERRRYDPRDINGVDGDDPRKRRPSPWGAEVDRRGSRESVDWEGDERFAPRDFRPRERDRDEEFVEPRRTREREEDYRRRRDVEESRYAWRKGAPESEYRREPARRSQDGGRRYYRDRSRESPWEDEYSEHGEDASPQYASAKRGWANARPSSATEPRRTADKSPGDHKGRLGDKPQYSLPAMRADRDRYRAPYRADNSSDQEHDYWPQERPRRESGGYEKRSQTLHARRPNKFKKPHERGYGQKSQFDDDFSTQPLSVSNSDIVKSQDSDTSEHFRKKSPINPAGLFTYTDSFPRRRDPYGDEIRTNEMVPSSPLDPRDSPQDEGGRSRVSRGSCNRQSPFEDDFTPPETRPNSGRRISSVSSDVSDRRSPYDEVRAGRRVPSVAEEREFDGDFKNGRVSDDVFLPGDTPDGSEEQGFADFDNGAFTNSSVGEVATKRPTAESRRTERRILREENRKSDKMYANKTRMPSSGSSRGDPLNIKKSESVNIFAREKDPFDDDDFFKTEAPSSSSRPRPDQTSHQSVRSADKSASNNGDPFKWTKAFDSFNFDEEN